MPSDNPPLVLDTHYWLWLAGADWGKFSAREKRAVESAALAGSLTVSIISVWEVGVLESKNRIRLREPAEAWLKRICGLPGLSIANLTGEIAWRAVIYPVLFTAIPRIGLLWRPPARWAHGC